MADAVTPAIPFLFCVRSEVELQSQLYLPCILSRVDDSCAHVGMSKIRMVEGIQKVGAELEPPHFADWEVLLKANVRIDVTGPNHRTLRRTVAELSRSGRRNERRVEPEESTLIRRLGIAQQCIVAVRSRTRRT